MDVASFLFFLDEKDVDGVIELNWLVDHVDAKLLLFLLDFELDDEEKKAVRGEENDLESEMWLDFDFEGFLKF